MMKPSNFIYSTMVMMKKMLSQRLFNISKMSSQGLMNCRISSSSLSVRTKVPKDPGEATIDPEPGDSSISRRFLNNLALNRSFKAPIGGDLIERLREMDLVKDRIRLDGLRVEKEEEKEIGIGVEDVRKFLRAAQIDVVKTKLSEIGESWIRYCEFVRVCNEVDPVQGDWIAKMLDDSGNVIVLGDSVCLRPDQVTKSIEGLLPLPLLRNRNDPRRNELRELEAIKSIIDEKAHALVRKELWGGLGYLIIQTVGLMRLTFWELTWDVMEPICYCITAGYFMAGYAFFLRTKKEPSFEGFYQSRFEAKQRKVMASHKEFDFERYHELKKLFNPKPSASVSKILGTL